MARRRKLSKRIHGKIQGWPLVTIALIGICAAAFLWQTLVPDETWRGYAFVPGEVVARPWTLVTSNFLHLDSNHLFLNMFFLAIFGYYVEKEVGRKGLLAVFMFTGVLSNFGDILIYAPATILLGASSAVLGVAGFFAVLEPDYPVRMVSFYLPAIALVMFYALFNFTFWLGSADQIAYGSHLVGLGGGVLLGFLWKRRAKT